VAVLDGAYGQIGNAIQIIGVGLDHMRTSQDPMVHAGAGQVQSGIHALGSALAEVVKVMAKLAEASP
jgi:hypothetical protein